MSADNFWFSDYEPVNRILKERGINLIVTAEKPGMAKFNPLHLDDATNKHKVPIEKSIRDLVEQGVAQHIRAVVFIGTETDPFRQDDATGRSVRRLLTELRTQEKWITSIGKGSEVPLHYGLYDGVEVCNSEYLDPSVSNHGAILVDDRVRSDVRSKVLTAAAWPDAAAFARELARIVANPTTLD